MLTAKEIEAWGKRLREEEKSEITVEKYLRDGRTFLIYLGGRELSRERATEYKRQLKEKGYAPRSVNGTVASLNSLFSYLGREDCRLKSLKLQKEIYAREEKELSKGEYLRLLTAAGKNPRLALILETICSTGIRVSELSFFTYEAVRTGTVTVRCKNKTRNILVPGKLRQKLLSYGREQRQNSGVIFRTRSGRAVSRTNIWAEMKKLCRTAGVNPAKVFPHNLRKLFARTFYGMEKDIAKLADLLGHTSIETTRIYIMTTSAEHRRKIDRLGLVV